MTEQSPAQRRTARIAGWLFVATFVTSIAGLLLYDPVSPILSRPEQAT